MITRPLAATFSLVALWFLAMVLEALRLPAWALAAIGGLLLLDLVVLIGSLHQATREPTDPGGDGGLPAPHPDVPGGGDEPSWWPELEGELTEYLAEHTTSNVGQGCLSARDDPARLVEISPD